MLFFRMALSLLFILCTVFPTYAHDNSCLDCHSALNKKSTGGKAYWVWKGSIHDKAGVTCENCHGGNPFVTSLSKAHSSISGPEKSESRVFESNIPKLCGGCHKPQFNEFIQSKHYRAIQSHGKVHGPTCFTCHGSMHTAILAPDNVADTCRRCHNAENNLSTDIPEEAHAVLDLIFYAKTTIKWSGEFIALAQERGYPVRSAVEALQDAKEKLHRSEIKWHSFDFNEILKLVDEAYESAKQAKLLSDEEVIQGKLKRISDKK